jgi:hypothetical protein
MRESGLLSRYNDALRAARSGSNSRRSKDFSLLHSVSTGSGTQPIFHIMDTGVSFPELKWPRRETHHSPPSGAEVKNGGATVLLAHASAWRDA